MKILKNVNYSSLYPALILLLLFIFSVNTNTLLRAENINKTLIGNKAIDGYDVVNYFKNGTARIGNKSYVYEFKGARWYFASKNNLDDFKKSPDKYMPKYGGYCAYAASKGEKASVDPEAFDIYKGKLYLNYDRDIQAKWRKNRDEYISKADTNWPKVSK